MPASPIHVCACGQLLDHTLVCPECLGSGTDLMQDWFQIDLEEGVQLNIVNDALSDSSDSDPHELSPTTYLAHMTPSSYNQSNDQPPNVPMSRNACSTAKCNQCGNLKNILCLSCNNLCCSHCVQPLNSTDVNMCTACQIQQQVCPCFSKICNIL
jgi:hypothetical protein